MNRQALAALHRLRDDPATRNPFAGICECAGQLLPNDEPGRRAVRWIRETAGKWPKRHRQNRRESLGDEHNYPVPGGQPAFEKATVNGTMWVSEYGQMRRELLDWLIAQAQHALAPFAPTGTRVVSLADVCGAPVRIEPRAQQGYRRRA